MNQAAINPWPGRGLALLAALGDDLAELLDLTTPWTKAVVAAKGYPVDPSSLASIARP